jgi:selenocysteine-specific elongation factor
VIGLLRRLIAEGSVIEGEGGFASVDATGALTPEQEALAEKLHARVLEAGLAPPTLASLQEVLVADQRQVARLLEVLVRRGRLVRAREDLWFAAVAVDAARAMLQRILTERQEVTLAEFRDAAGTGRRNAQALLELFDREGLTRRRGDARVLRGRR